MKEWQDAVLEELDVKETAKKDNGNNDTHEHLGWCAMHKNPGAGICTCGVGLTS